MTIGNKITGTCGLLVVMTAALGTASLVSVRRMNESQVATVSDALPGVYYSGHAEQIANDLRSNMLLHLESSSDQEIAQLESEMSALQGQMKETLAAYDRTISRADDREMFSRIEPAFNRWIASWDPARAVSHEKKNAEALAMYHSSVAPAFADFKKLEMELIEANRAYGDQCAAATRSASAAASWWTWTLLILSLLTGGGLGFFVIREINSTLRTSVRELSEGAEQVASAASQVASASQAMAQGASQQAGSLEETSASAQEISSMTRQNANNSKAAAEAAVRAEDRVQQANRTLDDMIASMTEINESSQKISKIIKVIDEIAFQTNILALNAAVEAARAGEAGMGFAVVADEVRNLAQRSAKAAKDTAQLIEESVTKSSEGSTKLNSVAEAIRAITDEAAKVKMLVEEVTAASNEQSQGMEQISNAISEMERVTQKNAASSEESASASEELSAQAVKVNDVLKRLRSMVERDAVERAALPVAHVPHVRPSVVVTSRKPEPSHDRAPVTRTAELEIPFDDSSFKEL